MNSQLVRLDLSLAHYFKCLILPHWDRLLLFLLSWAPTSGIYGATILTITIICVIMLSVFPMPRCFTAFLGISFCHVCAFLPPML